MQIFMLRCGLSAVILSGLLTLTGCDALKNLTNKSQMVGIASSTPADSVETPLDVVLENPRISTLNGSSKIKVDTLITESLAHQTSGDMVIAVKKMEDVVAIDPTNPTANFVLGINDVNELISNKEMRDALDELLATAHSGYRFDDGSIPMGTLQNGQFVSLSSLPGLFPATLFLTSSLNMRIQEVVARLKPILPRLDSAITRLQFVLVQPNFSYPASFSGGQSLTEINEVHVLAVYGALNIIRGIMYQSLAYELGFKEDKYQSMSEFMSKNPKFLTLAPEGKRLMRLSGISYRNVLTTVLELSKKNRDAKNGSFLDALLGVRSGSDLKIAVFEIEKWRRSLAGEPVSIPIQREIGGPITTIELCLGNFFNNPPQDFRKFLGINIDDELQASSFPTDFDFTLNGLFPHLKSYTDWQKYNFFDLRFYNPKDSTSTKANYGGILVKTDTLLIVGDKYSRSLIEVFKINNHKIEKKIGEIESNNGGYPSVVAATENAIYVLSGNTFKIYQVDGSTITKLGTTSIDSYSYNAEMMTTPTTVVIRGYGGVTVIDVSNPQNPVVSNKSLDGNFSAITFLGNRIYGLQSLGNATYSIVSFDANGQGRKEEYQFRIAINYMSSFMVGRAGDHLYTIISGYSYSWETVSRVVWDDQSMATLPGSNYGNIFIGPDKLGVGSDTSVEFFSLATPGIAKSLGKFMSITGVRSNVSGVFDGNGAWIFDGAQVSYKPL